jgi:pyruvate formate lyase activating enzyme
MKEALLYKKLKDKKVQCQNCAHYCLISPNKRGVCGVRKNRNGQLYSLVYGKAIAINIDPIEKKPFFHFLPGSHSLSIATAGCQFSCQACQNWQISQRPKLTGEIEGKDTSPKEIVKMAKKYKVPSISYTYTDPIVFLEYALDIMKLAKKEGLKNNWVTSGFLSAEAFDLISPYLAAANVDLKSFEDKFYIKYCGGKLQPVLDTLKRMKEKGIWLEVTTLVIPGLNDSKEIFRNIANFIKNELSPETPWHISQFCGAISWKLKQLPDTPVQTLRKAYQIGKKAGLKYVYTGNVPGLDSENTYCPKCQALMIERQGYFIQRFDNHGRCSQCGENLNLIE